MNLVDYEKYYHSGSEFIIPRDEFEKIIEENQRLNNVLNEIKIIIDDYYAYDYEDENLERLNVIDKINHIIKESDK